MPKNTPSRIIDNKQTRAVAFLGGSGSASGGVSDHGLLTGLADDDHAQYLRTDGTRTLTGNMAVAAAVTIDGVDISAHAADANAHHAQAHAITGSDHTVTGSTYQIVGLTGTNTIGLLTPASSPGANAVVKTDGSSAVTLVDLTVTSDLFMTGILDFGTDTITEDATYLQVAGSKAVRFAQNIGNANWTLYNAGGYTTTGSISITGTAGDLTVGSNVLFVDNSAANVGINMAPDSQFALDINGPARATYWIGPHAIQLKNVLLLAHYDGRAPYATNYSGEPNGHMGQVATVSGGVIYRPGQYYKAAQIAEATTNLIKNPSFEVNTTGWTNGSFTTFARQTDTPYIGAAGGYVKITSHNSSTNESIITTNITDMAVSASTSYTVSAYLKGTKTGTGTIYVFWYNSSSGSISSSSVVMPTGSYSEWRRVSGTVTSPSGAAYARVAIATDGCTNGTTVELWIDAIQFEAKAYLTPYCDGSLGDGHTWNSTEHNSRSSRTAAQLSYATAGNVSSVGTIMLWVKLDALRNWQTLWRARSGESTHGVHCYVDSAGNIRFRLNGNTTYSEATAAITAGAWTHVACTWNGSTSAIYVNGVLKDSDSGGAFYGMDAALWVGSEGGSTYFVNGLIDDFCILGYASAAGEILSVYESNAPVFAETSTFSFRPTPKGLIWADDEGLWMKDTATNPVFGIYGGDATKSWGGFTMAPGDLLIGNNAVGSSAIMWDQSAGTFGFYGAGNATAQVVINTDGTLYSGTAGAQRVQLSSAELAGYNSSNVKQWYGSTTDGKLYAGAGNVTLDATGIKIKVDDTVAGGWNELKFTSNLSANDYFDISSYRTTGGGNPIIVGSLLAYTSNASEFGRIVISAYGLGAVGGGHIGLIGKVGIGITNPSVKFQVAGSVTIGADDGGLAGYITYTNASNLSTSTGTGTVKLTAGSNRDSNGWVKIYVGATAYYIPVWSNIS